MLASAYRHRYIRHDRLRWSQNGWTSRFEKPTPDNGDKTQTLSMSNGESTIIAFCLDLDGRLFLRLGFYVGWYSEYY